MYTTAEEIAPLHHSLSDAFSFSKSPSESTVGPQSDRSEPGIGEDPWKQVERMRNEHAKMLQEERSKLAQTSTLPAGGESLAERARKLNEQAEAEKREIFTKLKSIEEEERRRREDDLKAKEEEMRR